MDSNVRIANRRLVAVRARRKFSCNLLLLPNWLNRIPLERLASHLELAVSDLEPLLRRYVVEDPQGHMTSHQLFQLLWQAGQQADGQQLLIIGMDRALALLSLQDARVLLDQDGGGALWNWQSGSGKYYLIPWLEQTKPRHWPVELCMRWEETRNEG